MEVIALFLAASAIGLFAISGESYVTLLAGMSLLAMAWSMRRYYSGKWFNRTKIDWPLSIFLLSGLLSFWVSYDPNASLTKFNIILGSIALYYALIQASEHVRRLAAGGLIAFALIVAGYFVFVQNDLITMTARDNSFVYGIRSVFNAAVIQFHRVTSLYLYQPQKNEVAGLLEISFVIGVGLLATICQSGRYSFRMGLLVAALAFLGFGLVLTGSRGAWMSIGLAGFGWYISRFKWSGHWHKFYSIALITIGGLLLFVLLWQFKHFSEWSTHWLDSDLIRLRLYLQTIQLIEDYLFTGAGLDTFPMLYSAYSLGWDVIFLYHAHNLYLAVWLEQGTLGLLALLWLGLILLKSYVQQRRKLSSSTEPLTTAAFWATAIVFLHGLVDSAHYNSPFLPLIFFSLGLIQFLRASPPITHRRMPKFTFSPRLAIISFSILVLLNLGKDHLLAGWYANLGSVAQAKIELADYHWPERIPSRLRATANLTEPITLFERALSFRPNQPSASRRLNLINQAKNHQ